MLHWKKGRQMLYKCFKIRRRAGGRVEIFELLFADGSHYMRRILLHFEAVISQTVDL